MHEMSMRCRWCFQYKKPEDMHRTRSKSVHTKTCIICKNRIDHDKRLKREMRRYEFKLKWDAMQWVL